MNLRYIDWIWHVRGSLALVPGQSRDDAFGRLDPLFHTPGTSHQRAGDTLRFSKKDPAAQDKMSVFESGVLQIDSAEGAPVLRYHLVSRALLFCFLLPLLFLGFAQLTIEVVKYQKASDAAAEEADKAAGKPKKPEKKKIDVPMNPIDKALGAPEPKKDEKKGDKKSKVGDGNDGGGGDGEGGGKKKPTPTPAYVFAGLFALLYVVGRLLEARLVRNLFQKKLLGT